MEFNDCDFDAFERDLNSALQEICHKYELKVKSRNIRYRTVDFDLRLTFEKNEMGLPAERIKFTEECAHYGFSPDDYLQEFEDDGSYYEFVGFQPRAKKYKCLIRNVDTREVLSTTEDYVRSHLACMNLGKKTAVEEESEAIEKKETVNHPDSQNGVTWVDEFPESEKCLTKEDLDFLKIKLEKGKRNERDWTQIKEKLRGKYMFSYIPPKNSFFVSEVEEMAIEDEYAVIFFDKEELYKHVDVLGIIGVLPMEIQIVARTFEDFLERANRNHVNIMFNKENIPNRKYYAYYWESQMLRADFLV